MSNIYLTIILLIIIFGLIIWTVYLLKKIRKIDKETNEPDNVVSKNCSIYNFDLNGNLQSLSQALKNEPFAGELKEGDNISTYKRLKNFNKYFDTCIKTKKNISVKLSETKNSEYTKRHEVIFSPVFTNSELTSVSLISSFTELLNSELSKQQSLEEQRNVALKLVDEIEAQKSELEQAFKKSSKHHIMLQKALRKIESQKEELESAITTINKQNDDLERANKEIKEGSRMKEIFLANTSHEIRTPLNAIIGFTNLLLNSKLNDSQKKYLDNIKTSSNHLLVVINDILDFSKIESGKMTFEQIEFEFKNFIKYTVNTLSVKAKEKNINLRYDFGSDVPEFIIGDPVRLNQILINLVGNSIKFTPEGGDIQLYIAIGEPVDDKIKVLFKVEDNGIGIPKNKLGDIFKSFTQAESDTTRNYGGTGLGLSIVKQLIELLGGDISVDSEVGKGTVFTFYILLKKATPTSEPHVKHKPGNTIKQITEATSILIVEDNEINRQLAHDTIKAWNNTIKIDSASNGKVALDKIQKESYNLILMDIQMPIMDGIEATKLIRQMDSPKKETPIIAMTAHALKNEKSNCLKVGMDDYISKPFDPEELYAKIAFYAPKDKKRAVEIVNKTSRKELSIDYKIEDGRLFNTSSLELIYNTNVSKILKIVEMCRKSIPIEIDEISLSYQNSEWEILRNKAHALKPKLGYLGMNPIQNIAKEIEIKSQKETERYEIEHLIAEINSYWGKAIHEIDDFINENKN